MVEEDPTWDTEIKDVLAANCTFCHGETPSNGAPAGFRLDVYDATEAGPDTVGAFEVRDRIRARAVNLDPGPMPPGTQGPPTVDQAKIDAWVVLGAPRSLGDLP